jgi:hypothetical protein
MTLKATVLLTRNGGHNNEKQCMWNAKPRQPRHTSSNIIVEVEYFGSWLSEEFKTGWDNNGFFLPAASPCHGMNFKPEIRGNFVRSKT